jgi:hypothetical protein
VIAAPRHCLALAVAGLLVATPAALAAPAPEPEAVASEVAHAPTAKRPALTTREELRRWLGTQQVVAQATRTQSRPAPSADRPLPKPLARPPKLQCTQPAIQAYLRRYTRVFNRGKAKRLRRFFTARSVPVVPVEEGGLVVLDGNARGFRWYTVSATRRGLTKSARRFFLGRKRGQVLRYAVKRHRHGERLRFVTITGFESLQVGRAPHAGVAFLLRRRAKDLLPRKRWRTVMGKALIDCQSGKISAFSL